MALIAVSAIELFRHAMLWRVPLGMEHFPVKWYYEEFNEATIIEWDEPRYRLAVHLGFLGTFISMVGVGCAMYYHQKLEALLQAPRRIIGGRP